MVVGAVGDGGPQSDGRLKSSDGLFAHRSHTALPGQAWLTESICRVLCDCHSRANFTAALRANERSLFHSRWHARKPRLHRAMGSSPIARTLLCPARLTQSICRVLCDCHSRANFAAALRANERSLFHSRWHARKPRLHRAMGSSPIARTLLCPARLTQSICRGLCSCH